MNINIKLGLGIVLVAAMLCLLPACSDNGDEETMDLSGESLDQDTEQEEEEEEEE